MKLIISILIVLGVVASFSTLANNAYIYDKSKIIWSLKGPSKEFSVAVKYPPGTKLTSIAGTENNGYTQVVDSRGRKSWVISSLLLPTANILLDQTRIEISALKVEHGKQVRELQSELAARAPLEKMNETLQSNIAGMQVELEQLRQSNSAMSNRFNREVYFAGGITVIVGILFGWIFGLRGRKRNSAWS
ncbi:MAG: hypothetical protein KUG78_01095 [Kangiellaceae bacterium]|nr:hypothetical protein [Kangiellaceae bacterium]